MIYDVVSTLDDLGSTVDKTCARLRERKEQFDSIVVSGMSGVIVGSPVALVLDKPLIVVRKETDEHHDHGPSDIINIRNTGKRWLFLDDFVSRGETYGRIRSVIAKERPASKFAGSYFYIPRLFGDENYFEGSEDYEFEPPVDEMPLTAETADYQSWHSEEQLTALPVNGRKSWYHTLRRLSRGGAV